MSRPRRFWRPLQLGIVVGLLVGVAFLLWRRRRGQIDDLSALGLPEQYSPPAPRSLGGPDTAAFGEAGPHRIPTRIHRGAPPARPAPTDDAPASPAPPADNAPVTQQFVPDLAPSPADDTPAPPAPPADNAPVTQQFAPALASPPADDTPAPELLGGRVSNGVPEADAAATGSASLGLAPSPADDTPAPEVIAEVGADGVPESGGPTLEFTPAAPRTSGLININSADADALIALPGIGPALAQRIIAHRELHGPFSSVDQLIVIQGIGSLNINEFRHLVTV